MGVFSGTKIFILFLFEITRALWYYYYPIICVFSKRLHYSVNCKCDVESDNRIKSPAKQKKRKKKKQMDEKFTPFLQGHQSGLPNKGDMNESDLTNASSANISE